MPCRCASAVACLVGVFMLGLALSCAASAADTAAPGPASFELDVMPILSKAGCNSGGCHGALAGKGGFRLSLFGYDPAADHLAITRDARGRRVDLADPGTSLLLTKPTMAVAHKGGRRLEVEGHDYKLLAAWISSGCLGPNAQEKKLVSVTLSPGEAELTPGRTHQLSVTATYSDGSTRDVTRWARFTSADETVATVDPTGLVTVVGHGEGAVNAWFSSQNALARVLVPFPHVIPPDVFTGAARENLIDDLVPSSSRGCTSSLPRHATTPPSSAAPSSTRSAACRRPRRSAATWPTPRPANGNVSSTYSWRGPNSSTIGPTSGLTSCS